jgi:formamidopyrimidine-DNA glycosylase
VPELVDVEIVRRNLQRWMRGARIVAVTAADRYILRPASPATFRHRLVGRTVRNVGRRGKWLRIELDAGLGLFSHLGMTGDWLTCKTDAEPDPHEHARLELSRHGATTTVRYVDPRRFGRLVASGEDIEEWTRLGRDPLTEGLDAPWLASSLASMRRSVKEVLMDQTVLAGIGNIVATEALWRARIDPRSRSDALGPADAQSLVRALQATIQNEIRHKGEGEGRLRIYGRAGQPCPRCTRALTRITLGGRTTALCTHCQVRRR